MFIQIEKLLKTPPFVICFVFRIDPTSFLVLVVFVVCVFDSGNNNKCFCLIYWF